MASKHYLLHSLLATAALATAGLGMMDAQARPTDRGPGLDVSRTLPPLRAPEVSPRLSGGVAHAMAVTVASSCRSAARSAACLLHRTRSIAQIFRKIPSGFSRRMLPATTSHLRVRAGQLSSWKHGG